MLRITVVEMSSESATLRVEGGLAGRWVEELRRSCNSHSHGDGTRLILNLADVSFVDAEGIDLLKELLNRQITLERPSPLVASHLLKAMGSLGIKDSAASRSPAKLTGRNRSGGRRTKFSRTRT